MDLLIDTDVAIDVCAGRQPHAEHGALAIELARQQGARLWLYCGSAQALEYGLCLHLLRANERAPSPEPRGAVMARARRLLAEFAQGMQWLAALAGEGPVFDAADPEAEQLLRTLGRFAPGSIKLLTRDATLLEQHPDKAITPEAWCRRAAEPPPIAFADLAAQQDAIRAPLEQGIHRVLHHGQYIMGPEVKALEDALAARTSARHCITVASGTEALLIALMALGVGPGDEVITSPFTFAATAETIALLGAVPVFVDVQADTANIDPAAVEAALGPRTRAIMPVSLYGQPADMDEIGAIARAAGGLPVVEDAAQSFGARYRGRASGSLSLVGCTSFFPSKPLGCYGDGGALFTSDDALAQAMREIRVHGQPQRYVHTRVGVGGRMDALQCAVVLAKLGRFDAELQAREAAARRYDHLLEPWAGRLQRPVVRADRSSAWAQYTVQLADREAVAARLRAAGVPTTVHYPLPLHQQPAYAHRCRVVGPLARAEALARRVLSLPMHADLDAATQARVAQTLGDALG
jgi:UDP-2-acetamido-2-deoxy-ribo-hexuluronate aminotransferase